MANNDDLSPLVRDLLYGEQFQLLESRAAKAAKRAVALGKVDPLITQLIREPVRKHKIAQAFAGPMPLPRLTQGDLILGFDQKGRLVRMPMQFLNGHSFTLGGSGSGKTTKSRFLILQIAGKVRGLWLFDLRKREFADLRPLLARLGIDLLVVPARQLRINPLQVPVHVDPADWAPRVADMLVHVLRLPARATKLLHATIVDLYRRFGIFNGGQRFPTLFDLRENVAADSEANPPARQATVDSLDPVLLSLQPALSWRYGWTTAELARRRIVFELGGIAEVDKDLILNTLILSEFTSRIAQGISNPKMDLWINCDEAARLVSASSSHGSMSDLFGLVRGTGIGLDLSVQSADIAPAILSNTANKFIGRCGSAADYDAIGTAMGLTSEQRRWLATTLKPGLFVGQLGEGDWRYPFVFSVPPMDLRAASAATPVNPPAFK